MAVQLTATKGSSGAGELKWMARAMRSFPVPVYPVISTVARFPVRTPMVL